MWLHNLKDNPICLVRQTIELGNVDDLRLTIARDGPGWQSYVESAGRFY